MIRATIFLLFSLITLSLSAQLNIERYMFIGQNKLYFTNYVGAIDNFNTVVKFNPNMEKPLFMRSIAKLQLEDYRGSIEDLNRAIEIKPFSPQSYLQRGMANHALLNYELAIEDYNRAEDLGLTDNAIFNNRGITKTAMKDYDGALKDYAKAIKQDSSAINSLMNRARLYLLLNEFDLAIEDCNRAIKINPFNSSSFVMRAQSFLEQKDFAKALTDIDKSIEIDPKNGESYFLRGVIRFQLEDYTGAIDDYSRVIVLNSKHAYAYFNRGITKERLGSSDAMADFRTAASLDSGLRTYLEKIEMEQLKIVDPWYYALTQKHAKKDSVSSVQDTTIVTSPIKTDSINPFNPTVDLSVASVKRDSVAKDSTLVEYNRSVIEYKTLPYSKKLENGFKRRESRRDQSERNLIVSDNGKIYYDDEGINLDDDGDGLIQNINVVVELLPNFTFLQIHSNNDFATTLQYYNDNLEMLNITNGSSPYYILSSKNNTEYNKQSRLQEYYRRTITLTQEIQRDDSKQLRFNRAISYILVNDYNRALKDFQQILKKSKNSELANIGAGNSIVELTDYLLSIDNNSDPEKELKVRKNKDYLKAAEHYKAALKDNPESIFALYNLANTLVRNGEYKEAEKVYSSAIKIEDDLSEAYFNRGITRIFLDDIEGGALDLSKAGELGEIKAYNIIKRYCN